MKEKLEGVIVCSPVAEDPPVSPKPAVILCSPVEEAESEAVRDGRIIQEMAQLVLDVGNGTDSKIAFDRFMELGESDVDGREEKVDDESQSELLKKRAERLKRRSILALEMVEGASSYACLSVCEMSFAEYQAKRFRTEGEDCFGPRMSLSAFLKKHRNGKNESEDIEREIAGLFDEIQAILAGELQTDDDEDTIADPDFPSPQSVMNACDVF